MTTGRINQVYASPQAAAHLRIRKCPTYLVALRQKLQRKFLQRDAICSAAYNQDSHNDLNSQDAKMFKRRLQTSSRPRCCTLYMLSFPILPLTHNTNLNLSLSLFLSFTLSMSLSLLHDLRRFSLQTLAGVQPQTRLTCRGGHVEGYSFTVGACHVPWAVAGDTIPRTRVVSFS